MQLSNKTDTANIYCITSLCRLKTFSQSMEQLPESCQNCLKVGQNDAEKVTVFHCRNVVIGVISEQFGSELIQQMKRVFNG